MPPAAKGHQTLSAYISSRFDEFSRSQKDVAQYVVDHLDEVAFHTAEELARRANTSSSTVVRFSQALGFEGYPELQQSAREEYRRRHAAGGLSGGGAGVPAPLFALDQNEFETALAADHVNVEETARKTSRRASFIVRSTSGCGRPADSPMTSVCSSRRLRRPSASCDGLATSSARRSRSISRWRR